MRRAEWREADRPVREEARERLDFILASEEDQHIPGCFLLVDLDDGAQRRV